MSTTLEEVINITSGFAFKSSYFNESKGLPLIRIRDVFRGFSETYYDGPYDESFIVNNGDLLVSMDGEFRACSWQGGRALLNQRVCRLEPILGRIDLGYLKYVIASELKAIEDRTPFVTVKHLSVKTIRAIRLFLPPLPEQRRIAAILDQADAIRRKRQKAIDLTEKFLKSAFLEMFGDSITGDAKFKTIPFSELTTRITYGFTCPMQHLETGIPILTAKNIRHGSIDYERVHYADQGEFDALTAKSKPNRRDILITKDGTIGRCAIYDESFPVCINQSVALVQPRHDRVNVDYLVGYINSATVQQTLNGMGKGNALKHLQITELAELPVPDAPAQMQAKYSELLANAKKHQSQLESSLEECNNLFNSLVQRAFRGELSPVEVP